jgi:hypothetical protein
MASSPLVILSPLTLSELALIRMRSAVFREEPMMPTLLRASAQTILAETVP